MGLFSWWEKGKIKKLPEGQENVKSMIGNIKNQSNISNSDSKINFSTHTSLRDYDEWYKDYHKIDEKYKGAISIYKSGSGENIITMNYRNGNAKDSAVLALTQSDGKKGNIKDLKYITINIDKMLKAIYDRNDNFRYRNLKGYLNEIFDSLKNEFDIEFTDEGKKILLNSERKFVYTDKTTILEKDDNGCVLGYKRLEDLSNYNAFEIPNEGNSYEGYTTVTVPVKKCNVEKISEQQREIIIKQLKELYQAAASLGLFGGTEKVSIQQYKRMIMNLRKNKI